MSRGRPLHLEESYAASLQTQANHQRVGRFVTDEAGTDVGTWPVAEPRGVAPVGALGLTGWEGSSSDSRTGFGQRRLPEAGRRG